MHQGIEHRVANVTPSIAEAWLRNFNRANRPFRSEWSKELANRMRRGEWELNGETIIFGTDGQLLDGQHRLAAVVTSGCTVKMLLVEGVDPDTWMTLGDTRARNGSDVLSRAGYKYSQPLASGARYLHRIHTNTMRGAGSAKSYRIDNAMVLSLVQENPDLIKALDTIMGHTKQAKAIHFNLGLLAALHCEFSRINEPDADTFLEKLLFGTGLSEGDSILLLRAKLFAEPARGGGRGDKPPLKDFEKAALTIKAWNFFRRNQAIKQLRWNWSGVTREPFPIPE